MYISVTVGTKDTYLLYRLQLYLPTQYNKVWNRTLSEANQTNKNYIVCLMEN